MKKYADKFVTQEIEVDTLPYLTESHLESLGVSTLGARLRILAAIKELKCTEEDSKEIAPESGASLKDSIETLNFSTNRMTELLKTFFGQMTTNPPVTFPLNVRERDNTVLNTAVTSSNKLRSNSSSSNNPQSSNQTNFISPNAQVYQSSNSNHPANPGKLPRQTSGSVPEMLDANVQAEKQ